MTVAAGHISASRKEHALRASWAKGWAKPPRMSLPRWADDHRKLARGFGATSGDWRTADFEISRGPMLAVTEPGVHKISVMCCTQLMKTELLLNIFGYFAHLDPCPALMLQPKDEAAEQFSKERVLPMVRATPVLKELVGGADQTLTYLPYPGGFTALAGAGSADNVARRPVRLIQADEIDKYRFTREGNTLHLAEERTAQFGLNWLMVMACSPTVEGESLIADNYYGTENDPGSDQRRASVACPHCSHRQFLDFFKHVEWEKRRNDKGDVIGHKPATARIHCEACGTSWSEGERLRALESIRWHQTKAFECCGRRQVPLLAWDQAWKTINEGEGLVSEADALASVWHWWDDEEEGRYAVYRARCSECGTMAVDNLHAGFQASKLFSPSQKDKPSDIAAKWLRAKGDPDAELAWWNTQMGLPHKPTAGKAVGVDALLQRREVYPAEVPDGVAVITCGIDTQDYRVEVETVGWGSDEESWSIDYHIIDGEFRDPKVQAALDEYLQRKWRRPDGTEVEVMASAQDSGGHHTQAVYDFCKARIGRRIWAVKGGSEQMGQRNPVWPTKRPNRKSKATYRPIVIGGNAAMDTIRSRLAIEPAEQLGAKNPGFMHFPADRDIGYFHQLTASRLVPKEKNGKRFRVWETPAGRANEAEDCRKYAYVALCGLVHMGLKLNARASAVAAQIAAIRAQQAERSDDQPWRVKETSGTASDELPPAVAQAAAAAEQVVSVRDTPPTAAAPRKRLGSLLAGG